MVEKYIILLLGVKTEPLPSFWHLQKEIFVLSKAIPKISENFKFEDHYNGPYCDEISDAINYPFIYDNAYRISNGKIILTDKGKKIFEDLKIQYAEDKRFCIMIKIMRLVRDLYDKLTKEELLFLIYQTYPEYASGSNIYDKYVLDETMRKKIAKSLLDKSITKERYEEVLNIAQNSDS